MAELASQVVATQFVAKQPHTHHMRSTARLVVISAILKGDAFPIHGS